MVGKLKSYDDDAIGIDYWWSLDYTYIYDGLILSLNMYIDVTNFHV